MKVTLLNASYAMQSWLNQVCIKNLVNDISSRDFSHFFESIGISIKKSGLEKSLSIGLKKFQYKKSVGIGLKNIWCQKNIGIGPENFGLEKSLSRISRKKVRLNSITLLDVLMSFSKAITASNTLKRFCLIKCFNSKKNWSQDWS